MTTLYRSLQPACAVIAIVLAAAGQSLHTFYRSDVWAGALFVLAVIVWLVVIVPGSANIHLPFGAANLFVAPSRRISKPLLVATIALALFAFFFSSGNQFTLDNMIAWGGSIIAVLYTFWEPGTPAAPERLPRSRSAASLSRGVLLAAILLIGAVFCFYNFDAMPPANGDHTAKLNVVGAVLQNNDASIYFDQVAGGEPLEIYLAAWSAKIFNRQVNPALLEQLTALVGWLLIPLTFLLARELFNVDVGLIAALLIAISKWNVTIARMGLQFVFAPFFIVLVTLFLVRGFKRSGRNDFLLAGFFLGVGLYGYSAFRMAPLLAIAFVALWLARILLDPARAHKSRAIANGALVFVVALIVALPLLRYAVEQPKPIAAPLVYLVGDAKSSVGNPLTTFAGNLLGAATMFNWTGDANLSHAMPNDPALDYVTGALFLLGVVFALYRLIRYREPVYAFLLLGLAVLVLPSALNVAHPSENPSIVRAAGTIPCVFILAALPLAWLWQFIKESKTTFSRVVVMVALLVLLAAGMRANFLRYYRDYEPRLHQESQNILFVPRAASRTRSQILN